MSNLEIKKVPIVGAGEMGHGIAQLLAQNGFEVQLLDKYPEAIPKAEGRIEADLREGSSAFFRRRKPGFKGQ